MSEQTQIELEVRGMTCPSCAHHVAHALQTVPGVEKVDVPGWQSARAIVIADGSLPADALLTAIQKAGYSAIVKGSFMLTDRDEVEQDNPATDFDLLVIGGGSGGFAAAITAAELGKRVGMINAGTIGGTCVNVGCVPSKTLIRAAQVQHTISHHPFRGIEAISVGLDWTTVRAEKGALVASLRQSKYVDVLAAYPNITFIEGNACFQPDGSVKVADRVYRASCYVIATGAQPKMLSLPGLEEAQPLNSTTLMDIETLPKSLIILGGRAVALELGQAMSRLGVQIVILQRSLRLISEHEPELGRAIQDYLEQEGIGVITGVTVERLSRDGDNRVVRAKVMGQVREYRAEHILMAVGRQPNTSDLGLEHVHVETDANGAIIVNGFQQTSNSHIYATGDVTTNPEFVYVAAAGGAIAARNALAGSQTPLDLSAMPSVIFTDPQIATVGLTEAQARQHGFEVKTSKVTLEYVPRALAARDTRGFIKLVADGATGRILGAHILAAEAGEVIQTAALAVKFGLTVDDLTSTLFPYLTQVEGLKLAAQAFTKDVKMLSCCAV